MSATESPLTRRAVDLIRARLAAGEHPQLGALATTFGLHRVTLVRACRRAGLALPQGRPRKRA